MKIVFTLLMGLFFLESNACCSHVREHYYPIGESSSGSIFIYLNLYSNCEGYPDTKTFYKGSFSLIRHTSDSNYVIQGFDTFHFYDNSPDSNSTLIQTLQPYYDVVYQDAVKRFKLKKYKPVHYTSATQNLEESLVYLPKDKLYEIVINKSHYKLKENLWKSGYGTGLKVNEVKEYKFKGETFYIVNVGRNGNKEYPFIDELNKEQFSKLNQNLTFVSFTSHGFSKDLILKQEDVVLVASPDN